MRKSFLLIIFLVFLLSAVFFLPENENKKEEKDENFTEETEIKEEERGYVTFWFDDALFSAYKVAFPVLKEKGWNAVVAVVTDYEIAKEKFSYDGETPMKMEEVLDLADHGWEISSHSRTHPHLNSIENEQVLEREIAGSKEDLQELGLDVFSFTFPYGEQGNSLGQNIVSREYFYWRSSMEFINEIPAWRHITSMFMTIETTEEDVVEWIAEAEQGGWLVVCFHGILSEPEDYWQQTPEQFMMVVEMIEESELEVVLPQEIFEKFGYAEGHHPKIDSSYRSKIIESDFNNHSFKVVVPEIGVDTDLHLASSLENDEIDFSALDDYPVWISDKESVLLSPLGDYGVSLIIGHRNLDFRHLDRLKKDDEILILKNDEKQWTYFVTEVVEIDPEEVWEELKKDHETSLSSNTSKLVLMTCTPYGTDWRRLLVRGKIKD